MIPINLEDKRAILSPMMKKHIEELYYTSKDPRIWEYLPKKINKIEEMETLVDQVLKGKNNDEQLPFVVYDKELGRIVGSTRYVRISEQNKNLGIGWTWYSPEVWRTRINTECKYLLLKHAFEVWNAVRVEFITTSLHDRSQKAIERLGARKEGALRKKYRNMDYVFYSIIDTKWPNVKNRLETFLR